MAQEHQNKGKAKPKSGADSREDRLKKALKANMARRKSQARARAANDAAETSSAEDKEA